MAATLSTMLPLGTKAPQFNLLDTKTNQLRSLKELQSNIATVVMFICNHCPYVIHIQKKLVEIANHYQAKGIGFIAINSNDVVAYPSDNPDAMRMTAENNHYSFPYLFDETQEVAKAYHAACTPDFYVFDKNHECVYRGRFDDSTPGNQNPVTGQDLAAALDAILNGHEVSREQQPSIGCNIKWKK
jgi:peroxiredoxin